MTFIANLFAVMPFAFGIIRFAQTGHDLRMLWMAIASFIGAVIVIGIARTRDARPNVIVFAVITLVVATLFATAAATMLGARAGPGAIMVSLVFGICWAVRYVLANRSAPPLTPSS